MGKFLSDKIWILNILTAATVALMRCKNEYVELYLNHSLMSDASIAFILGPFSRTMKFGKASLNGFKAFGCKNNRKIEIST